MKKTLLAFGIMALLVYVSGVATSCNKSDDNNVAPTLYDSLGGTAKVSDPSNPGQMIEKGRLGLQSVVDSTIFVIAADPALNNKFFSVLLGEVGNGNLTGFSALSKNLTDFFCVATGAKNFTYGGKNMVDAHDPAKNSRMGAKATSADFDQFVADLVIGAKKCGLSDQLIGQVGTLVYTLKSQVVQN